MKHSVSEVRLANGARGLFVHIPDATVMTVECNFRAGEYLVDRDKWETPHVMEHLLLGANEHIRKARAFQAEFEKNGAYCNASTSSYDITYESECADFEWERVLNLLMVAITKPLFLSSEFDAEMGNVREELFARSNNHFRHLGIVLRERFGFLVVTDKERIRLMRNVKLADIRRHYKKTHTSSNLRFVIAGNLPPSRQQLIRKLFASIELPKGDGRTALPNETPQRLDQPISIVNKTVDNLYFYVDTFRNRQLSDREADHLNLLNTMLTETLYSRILGRAREKGLVYHMSSGYSQSKNCANWWFGAQILPKNANALFSIMIKEVESVCRGQLKKTDIEAAKNYALGRYQRSGQTVSGTANGYSYRYFFDGHIDDYYKIPNRIAKITKRGITDVSRTMFDDNVWGFGLLGKTNPELAQELYERLAVLWP